MTMLKRAAAAFRYFWTGVIPLPDDHRPCSTDEFMSLLSAADPQDYAFRCAVEDWNEGNWASALDYCAQDALTPAERADLALYFSRLITAPDPLFEEMPFVEMTEETYTPPARKSFFSDKP